MSFPLELIYLISNYLGEYKFITIFLNTIGLLITNKYIIYNFWHNVSRIYFSKTNKALFVWAKNGKPHRMYKPAIIKLNNYHEWRLNGKFHRKDGPAFIGNYNINTIVEEWYKNGRLHCKYGPAKVIYWKNKIIYQKWYINGQIYLSKKIDFI